MQYLLIFLLTLLPTLGATLNGGILYSTDTTGTNARASSITITPSTAGTNLHAGYITVTNNIHVMNQVQVDSLQDHELVAVGTGGILASVPPGNVGDVLTSHGAGIGPSFDPPSGGDTIWTNNAGNIYATSDGASVAPFQMFSTNNATGNLLWLWNEDVLAYNFGKQGCLDIIGDNTYVEGDNPDETRDFFISPAYFGLSGVLDTNVGKVAFVQLWPTVSDLTAYAPFRFWSPSNHTDGLFFVVTNDTAAELQLSYSGSLYLGPNSLQDYEGGAPFPPDQIIAIHNVANGETAGWDNVFGSSASGSLSTASYAQLHGNNVNQASLNVTAAGPGNTYSFDVNANNANGTISLIMTTPSGQLYKAQPTTSDGNTSYSHHVSTSHTSGNLSEWWNGNGTSDDTNKVWFTWDGVVTSVGGTSSTATDTAVTIASTGWTNTFGKNAVVYLDGVGLTFKVADNAGTFIYTNVASLIGATVLLQPSGKVLITAGTLSNGRAAPF